jgi:hypothetical protein
MAEPLLDSSLSKAVKPLTGQQGPLGVMSKERRHADMLLCLAWGEHSEQSSAKRTLIDHRCTSTGRSSTVLDRDMRWTSQ